MSEREPETEYGRKPDVVTGDVDPLAANVPPRDPYTPEPGPRPGERRAFRLMWLALILIAIVVVIVLIGAFR